MFLDQRNILLTEEPWLWGVGCKDREVLEGCGVVLGDKNGKSASSRAGRTLLLSDTSPNTIHTRNALHLTGTCYQSLRRANSLNLI